MAAHFTPGGMAAPTTQVEIAVSCRNLPDMDITSKSDPRFNDRFLIREMMSGSSPQHQKKLIQQVTHSLLEVIPCCRKRVCVLYIKQFASQQWREVGRTEVIWDNLNPDFVKKFILDYFFEESQKLKFELYDIDSESQDLSKHDFLGEMECTLGEVVSSGKLKRGLVRGPKRDNGTIMLSAEELSSCKDEITLQFCGVKLDKKDFFGKSDPFLQFSKANEDGSFVVVHKTEVIKNTLNPTWRPFTVPVRTLCNGDYDRVLQVTCFDWNKSGSHSLIGTFKTTLTELRNGPSSMNDYECIHPEKRARKGKSYSNSGLVKLMSCKIEQVPSFVDYIRGGTQVHCTIAVDFTASNGDPRTPQSLHHLDPNHPNLYARALRAVGEIIQDYDSDKLFPALGYGARLPPDGQVSHEFFLNGHPTNPYCQGIDGVLQAYYRSLQSVQLYGPTNFAPVINHVARIASAEAGSRGDHYFILLILTDGIITDMPQTCEAIVNAATLPLSIIIVGIGDAEFDAMETLDGDDVRVSSKGRYAERDIVQFVPFREFIGGKYGNDLTRSQAMLAKEVLAEIPDQFVSYMKKKGIKPKPARRLS